MANYNLPTNINSGGTTTGHKAHSDTVHGFIDGFDTTVGSPASHTGKAIISNGTGWAPTSFTGAGLVNTTDRILFVSKAGNDSNDGRSWASAFLTIAAAIAAMSTHEGKIFIGAGTWDEGLTVGNKTLIGAGPYATFLRLTSNGDLLSFNADSRLVLQDLCLTFSSSSVTGRLAILSNSFQHYYYNVRFLGQNATGQIGLDMDANSGDCHFIRCKFESLDIGHRSITSISWFNHCQFSSNRIGCYIGDPTGTDLRGGMALSNTTFLGSGDTYFDCDGDALAITLDQVWFDGSATTAVKVGKADGTRGPRMFALSNCSALFGLVTSLVLYKATRVYLDNVKFHHGGGTPPTELSIPVPANVPQGHVNGVRSNQSLFIESLVPPGWDGYRGYISQTPGISGVETTVRQDAGSTRVYKRIPIRITGRVSGDAESVITFPAAFETSERYVTFNNTGWSVNLTATTLTIPTGVSGSGMIVVEGW